MKNFILAATATMGLLLGSTALACPSKWTVNASRTGSLLQLEITEATESGPACNLVVTHLNFLAGVKTLALDLSPATYCPLEAVAHRQAALGWQIPFGQRTAGEIQLVVNGDKQGLLRMTRDGVQFEGECK